MRVLQNEVVKQLSKFMTVGVLNTLISIAVIYALKYFVHASDVTANLAGYGVGIVNSYLLNSRWTFASTQIGVGQFLKFCAVNGVSYGANLATVLAAIHWAHVNSYAAQLLGMPVYTLTSYTLSRWLVFGQSTSPDTATCPSDRTEPARHDAP